MHTPHRLASKIIVVAVAAGVLVLAAILLTPSPSTAKPVISWTPESMTQTILAGESVTVPVSFTATKALTNVVVRVVPELAPYVQTNPTSFASIAQGQTVNLDVTISAPADALPKVVEGTVQVRSGDDPKKTFATPLAVKLDIRVGQRVTNIDGGYTLIAPLDWQVETGVTDPSFRALLPAGKTSNPDSQYVADIFIRVFPNPTNVNLVEFYQLPERVNFFQSSRAQSEFNLNGFEAARFEGVYGMQPNTIVAVRIDGQVIEFTDFDEGHQADGIFDSIVSSLIPLP